jgi:hypothetical protein
MSTVLGFEPDLNDVLAEFNRLSRQIETKTCLRASAYPLNCGLDVWASIPTAMGSTRDAVNSQGDGSARLPSNLLAPSLHD